MFDVEAPRDLLRYMVAKGSIAIDGISLTIAGVEENGLSISIIPHTLEETTLGTTTSGTKVNIEVDIIAKYVESLIGDGRESQGLKRALSEGGFLPMV